jgi:hypothetical protein
MLRWGRGLARCRVLNELLRGSLGGERARRMSTKVLKSVVDPKDV